MSAVSFDEMSDTEDGQSKVVAVKPFWKVRGESDKEILDWLNVTFTHLYTASQPRFARYMANIAAYRGIQFQRSSRADRERAMRDSPKRSRLRNLRIEVNNLHDIIEQNVSREVRFRPAVNFMPTTNDHEDKMASTVVGKTQESIWYRENIDQTIQQHSRNTKVVSESYIKIEWDENKGPLHPDWVRKVLESEGITKKIEEIPHRELEDILRTSKKKNPKIKFKDPDSGKDITIERPLRIGEEKFKIVLALNMLLQPKRDYNEVEWALEFEFVNVETLQGQYPECADKIHQTKNMTTFDHEEVEERRLHNEVLVMRFTHKGTELLDAGAHIVATPEVILENKDNIFAQLVATNGFPWVRRTDIDVPGALFGAAAIEFGRPLQSWINRLSSLLVRQQALTAHPKWVAPQNSVTAEALGNDSTIMWYKGPVAPKLEQPNPGSQNTFKLIEIFDAKLQQIMGVFGGSRGAPPTGITAGVALQFLNEQENERANSSTADHNSNIRDLAILTAFLAGEKYDKSDERLERLLGAGDARLAKYFDLANLSREWDVKAQTASALPQQKGQRISAILELRKEFPDRVDDDEVLDQIGFGSADKFITVNTVNIRSAESENDMIMRIGKTEGPEKWEDHLTHYRIHIRKLAEPEMKDGTVPAKSVNALKDHIGITEMWIEQLAVKQPQILTAVLAEFPFFPLFLEDQPLPDQVQPDELPIEESAPLELAGAEASTAPQVPFQESPVLNPGQEFPPVENEIPGGGIL